MIRMKGANHVQEQVCLVLSLFLISYNTVSELMALQDKVDQMQKHVFSNLRPSVHNECRIAALVPLVEESYGIYKFITSMLTALHALIPNMEVLSPLRERYKIQYQALSRFYSECSNLRYLTSLITIPKLPPVCEYCAHAAILCIFINLFHSLYFFLIYLILCISFDFIFV